MIAFGTMSTFLSVLTAAELHPGTSDTQSKEVKAENCYE